jgi:Uma2 family endonuclease
VKTSQVGEVFFSLQIVFDDYNAVIPDLVYVSTKRRHIITPEGLIDAPDLVVEVASPGEANKERDRTVKRRLYSSRGVREYWVADLELRTIEVYRLQENVLVLVATLHDGDALTSPLLPGFSCAVSEIFV